MVLNSNFELVGIVSSIQDNIVVKGQPAKGRFAFIADLRGPLARSLYKQAILCPKESGRHCAQRFPNAWIEGQQAIASADYANREGGRCPVRLTQTYDKNSEVLEKIELHGLERPCDIYSSVFENCVDNECWSNSTCESLTLQPAGFSLHTRGKSYSFGRLEHVKVAKLDETAPDFMPKGTSPCYRQVISEPHQIYCRKDGSKWLWFGAYFTWEQGQKLCSKYNYALPAGTQAKDFPSSTEVRTRFWTDDPAAKTLVPSRSYIDDSKKESPPQLKAGPLDGKFGAGVLCYCDPNQFR